METRRLDELCVQITDCPHSTPQWLSSGKLVLRNFNIHNGRIDLSDVSYTDEETFFARNKRATPIPGDIVMSREAPMGEVAIIPNGFECCLGQRMVLLHPDATVCNGKFLMYSLLSPFVQKQIKRSDTTGSVVSNLCIPDLCALEISYVNIERQECIVALLSDIDSKIDNNNVIAAELEGMAKDLYDYWFVQLDFPDENGKPYKSSGGKMVWNEELNREIPEGWEVDRLGKVCDTLLGGTPDTENALYWNGDIPWLNSGEVATSPVLNAEKKITKEGLKNSATSFASAGAVVMSITRYIRPSILGIDACFNQSVIAVIPNEQIHSTYLYLFMLSQVERYMRLRTGAQQPHINKETVDSTLITLPVDSVLNRFYDRVEPLFERQMIAMKEAKELESLRDFLLPMLMNGQVKVKGA